MTLGEKADSAWLDSLDYWSGRTARQPGMRGLFMKRLPPIMVCVAALALTVLGRIVFSKDEGYLVLATLGPGTAAWGFIRQSNTRARERHDARPERVPERIEAVKRSLLAAAGKTEQAMATTRGALAQSHQLSADLQAQIDSLTVALPRMQAEVEEVETLLAVSEHQIKALRSRVIKPEVRHLDRMGLAFAASGWVAAVFVVVFDHYIPRW